VTAVPDSKTTFTVDVGTSASGTYTSGGSVQLVSSLSTDDKAFQANSNNLTFSESLRKSRLEIPRFQNSSVIVRGDLSKLSYSSGSLVIADTSSHLHVDTTIDLSRNSILDEIKMAFSVISKNVTQADPYKIILVAEFGSDDPITGSTIYARLQADLVDGQNGVDFATNRYFVNSVPIRDLATSSNGFSWSAVKYVRIFASVYATSSDFTSGTVSDDYYIALDGIRLDNISSTSAVYGLTGYTVIKNNYSISGTSTPTTATKESDESHIVEFRFVADVI
jgi:hypothetical protein